MQTMGRLFPIRECNLSPKYGTRDTRITTHQRPDFGAWQAFLDSAVSIALDARRWLNYQEMESGLVLRGLFNLWPATFRRRSNPLHGEGQERGCIGLGSVAGVGELARDPDNRVDQSEDGEAPPLWRARPSANLPFTLH